VAFIQKYCAPPHDRLLEPNDGFSPPNDNLLPPNDSLLGPNKNKDRQGFTKR